MRKKFLPIVFILILSGAIIGTRVFKVYSQSLSTSDLVMSQQTKKKATPAKLQTKESEDVTMQVRQQRLTKVKAERRPFKLPSEAHLNVPLIKQLPELPRGCEVTSLAMLLNYAGYSVSKETLAKQVKKDPTPYKKTNGHVHFGNPNHGFVGAMDTFDKPGLGVYHGPIAELAERYMGERVIDLTGKSFSTVLKQLAEGAPVWIINNTLFTKLSDTYWEKWSTPEGPIEITYKEHSVLVTGYDNQWIYFNDPLAGKKDRRIKRASFIEGWKQMGSQAISYDVTDAAQLVNNTVRPAP
ncbi:hypothetical protein GCM10011391_19150 [Pullulanibacillus camelliae]|uniref:Peptidase C39-like domain-containing protein n=1 Tax=Pullulanibacillus camelliae TaxID=1707096 RepID=A0A8J2W1X4_9BACL|nr:C39 family peptidase [Pullulanibacillus camelliae]GGE40550.1 hypothetical protein GCM10011391_19150 [Pullulanibacillus camelliae]